MAEGDDKEQVSDITRGDSTLLVVPPNEDGDEVTDDEEGGEDVDE
ncbi:MAG: hypothetical protein ACRCT1_07680 [Microcoleaceae cyanobacterium]